MKRSWLLVLCLVAALCWGGSLPASDNANPFGDSEIVIGNTGTTAAAPDPVPANNIVAGGCQTGTTASDGGCYTVQEGDYLIKIARDVLGDASRFIEIIELNKDQFPQLLKNPDLIFKGWTLKMPPKKQTDQPAATPAPTPTPAGGTSATAPKVEPELTTPQKTARLQKALDDLNRQLAAQNLVAARLTKEVVDLMLKRGLLTYDDWLALNPPQGYHWEIDKNRKIVLVANNGTTPAQPTPTNPNPTNPNPAQPTPAPNPNAKYIDMLRGTGVWGNIELLHNLALGIDRKDPAAVKRFADQCNQYAKACDDAAKYYAKQGNTDLAKAHEFAAQHCRDFAKQLLGQPVTPKPEVKPTPVTPKPDPKPTPVTPKPDPKPTPVTPKPDPKPVTPPTLAQENFDNYLKAAGVPSLLKPGSDSSVAGYNDLEKAARKLGGTFWNYGPLYKYFAIETNNDPYGGQAVGNERNLRLLQTELWTALKDYQKKVEGGDTGWWGGNIESAGRRVQEAKARLEKASVGFKADYAKAKTANAASVQEIASLKTKIAADEKLYNEAMRDPSKYAQLQDAKERIKKNGDKVKELDEQVGYFKTLEGTFH